jgi:hypothetical protein
MAPSSRGRHALGATGSVQPAPIRPRLVDLVERKPKKRIGTAVWTPLLIAVAVGMVAALLRAVNVTGAYELFIDEVLYTDLGRSFAEGNGPRLFGAPFFLHPPMFFLLLGEVLRAPLDPLTVDAVLALRPVNVVFGAVNAALVVGITHKIAGMRLALVAGALYAVDPFVVLFDSRVLLETPTMTGVLGGVAALTFAVDRIGRVRMLLVLAAGVSFGIALLTKETSALVTTAPLILMAFTRRGLPGRELWLVILVQWAMFAVYVVWVWLAGLFPAWWEEHTSGVLRAVGVVQTTGFNADEGPGFVERVVANLDVFAASYAVIGLGLMGVAVLVVREWGARARTARSFVLLWLGGILPGLAYTVLFGTLEQQTFYLAVVPAILGLVLVLRAIADGPSPSTRVGAGLVVAALLVAASAAWTSIHLSRDDSYRAFSNWASTTLPPGSSIALTEGIAQFVLPGFVVHEASSEATARAAGARYVLVSTQLADLGFGEASRADIAELDRRYQVVFEQRGRSAGALRVYDLARPL